MNRYRTVLEGSLQLAREGNTEAAIHALESILDGPIADDSLDWISLLPRPKIQDTRDDFARRGRLGANFQRLR
jgi:hypothetical protein